MSRLGGILISSTALISMASVAWAEDVLLRADISAATVYASQAVLTREVALDLPAGAHVLHLAVPDADAIELPQIAPLPGVTIGPVERRYQVAIAEGALDTPAQAEARVAVEAAQEAIRDIDDQIALAGIVEQAASLQLAQLEAVAGVGEVAEDLSDRLDGLATEWTRAARQLHEARLETRALTEAREEAQRTLAQALEALRALAPYGGTADILVIPVESDAAIDATLRLSHIGRNAFWRPRYDVALDSETGAVRLGRTIELEVLSGEVWRDVALRVSTENPSRSLWPNLPRPTPARIFDPDEIRPAGRLGMADIAAEAAMPMMEPVIAFEDTAVMEATGLAISYSYAAPVSIGKDGLVSLPFDTLDLPSQTEILAVPRVNSTAFLMAEIENTSGEPILPGAARIFRDGALVGETQLPMIAMGAEERLAFGPVDTLRLSWQDLSRDDGDRGIFTTSNTQDRALQFTVENTGSRPAEVTVLYALPFAEQEDVSVTLDLSTMPDTTAWDDLRGVHAWEMSLDGGESTRVDIGVEIVWPEGQMLSWTP